MSVRGDDIDGWTALQHICSRASGMDARVGADQRREHLDLGHDATDVSTDATCSEIRVRADPTAIRLLTIQPGSHSACFSSTIDRVGSTSSQTHPTTSQAHEYQQLPRGWNEGATAFTGPEPTFIYLMMSTAKSICSLRTEMPAAIVIPGENTSMPATSASPIQSTRHALAVVLVAQRDIRVCCTPPHQPRLRARVIFTFRH